MENKKSKENIASKNEVKLYYITKDYLQKCISTNEQVLYKYHRPYVGIMLKFNQYDYFVPLSHGQHQKRIKNKQFVEIIKDYDDEGTFAITSCMLPVPKHCLNEIDVDNINEIAKNEGTHSSHYRKVAKAKLLLTELKKNDNVKNIRECAYKLYSNIRKRKVEKYVFNTSVNFGALEKLYDREIILKNIIENQNKDGFLDLKDEITQQILEYMQSKYLYYTGGLESVAEGETPYGSYRSKINTSLKPKVYFRKETLSIIIKFIKERPYIIKLNDYDETKFKDVIYGDDNILENIEKSEVINEILDEFNYYHKALSKEIKEQKTIFSYNEIKEQLNQLNVDDFKIQRANEILKNKTVGSSSKSSSYVEAGFLHKRLLVSISDKGYSYGGKRNDLTIGKSVCHFDGDKVKIPLWLKNSILENDKKVNKINVCNQRNNYPIITDRER